MNPDWSRTRSLLRLWKPICRMCLPCKSSWKSIKSYGFSVALDDVGTGHSNLERIARIKPDIIKIDRCLIHDLDQERYRYIVVRSLRNLAQSIGALVLAEGLETEGEALAALDLDINLHQGYYYAKPEEYLTG